MLWNSGASFFHRDQLLTWVHAIRWKPPFGAIHLTDSRKCQGYCRLSTNSRRRATRRAVLGCWQYCVTAGTAQPRRVAMICWLADCLPKVKRLEHGRARARPTRWAGPRESWNV